MFLFVCLFVSARVLTEEMSVYGQHCLKWISKTQYIRGGRNMKDWAEKDGQDSGRRDTIIFHQGRMILSRFSSFSFFFFSFISEELLTYALPIHTGPIQTVDLQTYIRDASKIYRERTVVTCLFISNTCSSRSEAEGLA